MKRLIRRILPGRLLDTYHLVFAHLAAWRFGYPSRAMRVVGVTGTNGKSTVTDLITRVLEHAGHTVGSTSTVSFKIGKKEWLNDKKMTMLGRFALQRMLREMADAGCDYAIIETSSEGIKQHRHIGVAYDAAVFTNLTPEHIESHGGFENYKKAKGKLFASLASRPPKQIDGQDVKTVSVVNLGDPHAAYFREFAADKVYGYLTERADAGTVKWPIAVVKALDVELQPSGSRFKVRDQDFHFRMPGLFNVENALAAIAYGMSQGIALDVIADALESVEGVPGRLEMIDAGQPFTVVVDYAPEPASFAKLYEVVDLLPRERIIHVLGSCGGGRDVDRRAILGRMAGERADTVIVTNEDPYDDDPESIIRDVAEGAEEAGKKKDENLFLITDRGEAIDFAITLARPGDLVLVTGKGAEQAIASVGGEKIPWDDRVRVREAIHKTYPQDTKTI